MSKPIDPAQITLITGRIETADGYVREFQITDAGYSQWGNVNEALDTTVDALDEITTTLREGGYIGDAYGDDDEPIDADD